MITEDKLSFIQKSLDMGEYDVVVKECATLFEVALKRIFNEAIISLPFNDRIDIQEVEKKIGKNNKGVQEFTFGELVGLFRESKLLAKWAKHSSRDLGLLNSLDFSSIVNLRNHVTHSGIECNRFEAELVYNYLRNMLATLGLADLNSSGITLAKKNYSIEESENHLEKDLDKESDKDSDKYKKIFKYLPERGLLVNPADGSRNVSFKVETINKIFDIIYNEISVLADEDAAQNIFKKAGYDGGKKFGGVMNQKWELEQETPSMNEKFIKWCEFDSDVGLGKFTSSLDVDEETGEIEGNIIISENFLNDEHCKKNSPKTCSFIKGYCEGVIEELLGGLDIEVVCQKENCPKHNAFKKKCIYQIQERRG
ncbi:MAG: hypothetical protein APF84_14590 [Gracilibacter sp. BRH_c7a]|nr:MAG: hypothetical protein APF84_14590 [Gracilibacter sp. BRH_c7a]